MDLDSEVLQVAKTYLDRVSRSGPDNVMAVCPFHVKSDGTPEKSPSFALSLTKGLYFCHACGAKGGFKMLLNSLGLSDHDVEMKFGLLVEALRDNIPPPPDPTRPSVVSESPIPERLLGLFHECPVNLLSKGFEMDTLAHFDVGFDRQHLRVTHPLRDLDGQLVGVSGRTIVDANPRYKVYDKEYKVWGLPARTGWDRGTVLYNAHEIYPELYFHTRGNYVVLVEGFKGCMWVWQAGIRNVVALLGTNLTYTHKWILEKMGVSVYLLFDHDYWGAIGLHKAAQKLLGPLTTSSAQVKVMEYPTRFYQDDEASPDDLTPQEIRESWAYARDYGVWLRD